MIVPLLSHVVPNAIGTMNSVHKQGIVPIVPLKTCISDFLGEYTFFYTSILFCIKYSLFFITPQNTGTIKFSKKIIKVECLHILNFKDLIVPKCRLDDVR